MGRSSLVTLTLHPSIDRVLSVERLLPGELLNSKLLLQVPAGKGINSARSLRSMLGQANAKITALAWIGHGEKRFFNKALNAEKIGTKLFERACITRISTTILETETQRETHLKESMSDPSAQDVKHLLEGLQRINLRNCLVACCGSAPPGTTRKTLRTCYELLVAKADCVIADTYGSSLQEAPRAGVFGIKGNAAEFAAWLGLPRAFTPARLRHMQALRARLQGKKHAPQMACVTLGATGAVLLDRAAAYWAKPPEDLSIYGKIASSTGCGDAATAAWMLALQRGLDLETMTRMIVAGGTTKLFSADPGHVSPRLFKRILQKTQAIQLF